MSWAEGNYVETRFLKGMNSSVEPHTLDRDTGELPDIFNMVVRTQGLRTRKGWQLMDERNEDILAQPYASKTPVSIFIFDCAPLLLRDGALDSGAYSGGGGLFVSGGGEVMQGAFWKRRGEVVVDDDNWRVSLLYADGVYPYVVFETQWNVIAVGDATRKPIRVYWIKKIEELMIVKLWLLKTLLRSCKK